MFLYFLLFDSALSASPHTHTLRALVTRTGEALALVRVLAANNLGRLAARLDDASKKYLSELVGVAGCGVVMECFTGGQRYMV